MGTSERTTDRQIAVLIDVENVGLNSIQWLFDQISDVGRIIVKRAYADWSIAGSRRARREQLIELGIEPIHLPRSTHGGKNSSDIRLAIDAVDLMYSSPVDIFVIVSSDSDFVPLVRRLRAAGKTVFGAGEQAKALPALVKSCDRYFYLDQDEGTRTGKTVSLGKEKEQDSEVWWEQIDSAWSKLLPQGGEAVPGPRAAIEAAKVLGVAKLSASPYKTLQGLLDASGFLAGKWRREKNTIIRW